MNPMYRYAVSADKKQAGEEVEKRFKEWLDRYELIYTRIDQTPETFSKSLRVDRAKRPDFDITIGKGRGILVDTKHLPPHANEQRGITINRGEVYRLSAAENKFGKPVFLVFSSEVDNFSEWFGVQVDYIRELGRIVKSSKSQFFVMPLGRFNKVEYSSNPSLLFYGVQAANKETRWYPSDDNKLKERYLRLRNLDKAAPEESIVKGLSVEFGRQYGGLRSRLRKLGILG
ncbi:MAG: hypothetical protein M1160_03440 [Candidatus Marsarchaeota archaeon]|jgi:hypothetical protein|nr:hypothetical protein [Candidatus Marsarchaeota archaeon]MCL5111899.1 hypothetical protein [Candidatus Marsarchaeota archaeon]